MSKHFIYYIFLSSIITALCFLPVSGFSQTPVYQMQNGIVVIEFESVTDLDGWVRESSLSGFTGEGYLRWAGANSFGSPPGIGELVYSFSVPEAGRYTVDIRSRKDNPTPDQDNDSWFSLAAEPYTKGFTTGNPFQWTFDTIYEPSSGVFISRPTFFLEDGVNTFRVQPRSNNHRIDRVVISREGTQGVFDLNLPESSLVEEARYSFDFRGFQSLGWVSGSFSDEAVQGADRLEVTEAGLKISDDPTTDTSRFGYGWWDRTLEERLTAGDIWRITLYVTSNIPASLRQQVPSFRFRISNTSNQTALTYRLEPFGSAQSMPVENQIEEIELYYVVPATGQDQFMTLAFDWIYVPNSVIGIQDPTLGLTLQRVDVELITY